MVENMVGVLSQHISTHGILYLIYRELLALLHHEVSEGLRIPIVYSL